MKQISSFMADITDEFKIIVVDAIRSLCLKFPAKQAVMLSFLSGVLRDEGGYDFKNAVVEAIFDMIKYIKDCRETGVYSLFTSDFRFKTDKQPCPTCANLSRIVNSPSCLYAFCTFSVWKDPRRETRRNLFVTFTIVSCLKMLLCAQRQCRVWPSLVCV